MAPPFRILGPLEIEGAGPLGGPRPRALLRTLLLSAGRVVTADRLIDAVWGEAAPDTARHALQVYLSQLRKAIPDGTQRIRTEGPGYRIAVSPEEVDALVFEARLGAGRVQLAAGKPAAAAEELAAALALWRGEIETSGPVEPEVARLEELRLAALELRVEADLALGRHAPAVAELDGLVAEHPLRERLREHLMLALYRAGRQADALAVFTATRALLVDELGLEPGPRLRELEAAILRHDPALDLAAVSAVTVRLPAPATPLVGRGEEIEALRGLLLGEARLVTVTGPGGAGKTRIAIAATQALAPAFRDGAVFVGLAALREPALVGAEIAAALAVEAGARTTEAALAEFLSAREVLLLLDNFEQVDDASPLLSTLLSAAPGLRLLVTSRRVLRLYGEHEFELPPLRLDDEAVPLFLARARAAGATDLPAADVARACEALDRLPLAIELAAARARRIAPAEMLGRLASRLELASDGPRDAPQRHRRLEETIAWSHDLLGARLQEVFAALSVFAGGWDAEAALAVAGAEPDDLDALVGHSLVGSGGERHELLETIREFAAGRLDAGGRADAVRDAHARHYLAFADEAQRQLRSGGDQPVWLDRLEQEHDNLRAALARLAEVDPHGELKLAGALSPFWAIRGHAAEALERLDSALDRAGPGATLEHAHALAGASVMSWIRGDPARSGALAEQALDLYRALDDAPGMVRALASLGYAAMQAGEIERATALYEECLAIARAGTNRRSETVALNCLTELALRSRDLAKARSVGEEGLALARALTDEESTAVALLNLGYVAVHQARHDDGRPLLREAAQRFRSLGDLEVTAQALSGLAATLPDRPDVAARLLGAAAAMRESVGGEHDFEPEVRHRAHEAARAALGDERFGAELVQGRAMTAVELFEGALTDL